MYIAHNSVSVADYRADCMCETLRIVIGLLQDYNI